MKQCISLFTLFFPYIFLYCLKHFLVTGNSCSVDRAFSAFFHITARLQLQFSWYFSFRLDKHLSLCTIRADSIDPAILAKGLVADTPLCQRMSTPHRPYLSEFLVIFNWHLHLTFSMHLLVLVLYLPTSSSNQTKAKRMPSSKLWYHIFFI